MRTSRHGKCSITSNPDKPINVNVAEQLYIYAPAGDVVINLFDAQTAGMTPADIQANYSPYALQWKQKSTIKDRHTFQSIVQIRLCLA